jgi:hypothetical protein
MSKTFELAATLAGRAHTAAVQLHPAVIAANHAGDAHSQVLAASVPTINSTEPPGGASLLKIGGWISWGAFAACVVGVFIIVRADHRANSQRPCRPQCTSGPASGSADSIPAASARRMWDRWGARRNRPPS